MKRRLWISLIGTIIAGVGALAFNLATDNKPILGLDLQGGSHLLLEVKVSVVLRERLESIVDAIRVVLRKNRIGYTRLGLRGNTVNFSLRKISDVEKAQKLVNEVEKTLELLVGDDKIGLNFNAK